MMSSVALRPAKVTDAQGIAALSVQLGYPADALQIETRLSAILSSTDNCAFAALLEGEVVGWVHGFYTLRVESEAFVEIGGLVVDESKRKQGIGAALVSAVEGWAHAKDCSSVRVRCNIVRKESHKFYARLGFTELKEQKVFGKKLDHQ